MNTQADMQMASRNGRLFRGGLIGCVCVLGALTLGPGSSLAQLFPDNSRPVRPNLPVRKNAAAVAGGEFTIQIEGTKQGKLKGDGGSDALKERMVGVHFEQQLNTPASGKRSYEPLEFVKEWGPSSPQLMLAAATGEMLRSVQFEFNRVGTGGSVETFYMVRLSNAKIVEIRQFTENGQFYESVRVTFERINVEHYPAKTTFQDDGK